MRQARRTGGRPAMDRNSLEPFRCRARGFAFVEIACVDWRAIDLGSESGAGRMGEDDKTYSQEIQDRIRELAHSMWEWAGRQQDMALHYWVAAEKGSVGDPARRGG